MWKHLSQLKITLIAIPLIRFAFKVNLFVLKRAARLRQLLALKLGRQIRLTIPEARLEGYDEEIDGLVHLAKLRLTYPEIFDGEMYNFITEGLTDEQKKTDQSLREEYEIKKAKVDSLVEQIRDDKTVKDTIRDHWLVQHFIETCKLKVNLRVVEHYLESARKLNPEAQPLSHKDLATLRKKVKKDIAELGELISDRSAIKISLSITEITSWLAIISPFFLFTGYLYNHYLLGEFGIEVSKYFRLTDYISSSIEGIRYSVVGAGFGVLTVFLGMHNWSRKSAIERQYEKWRLEYWFYLSFGSCLAGSVLGYVLNLESFYGATFLTITLTCVYFAPRIARKYFKEPLMAWFVLLFTGYFSAYMFLSIGTATYRYKNFDFSKLTTLEVKFSDHYLMKEAQLILLAGNSDYFFFLDHQRKPLIVPRVEVIQLRPNVP